MTRSSRKPPFANRSANSSRVRSSAPCVTSILRSENFASAIWLGGANDPLNHNKRRRRRHGPGTCVQNFNCLVIIPIMQNDFHDIGIAPRRDSIEEAPGHRFHTIFQSRRCHQCRGLDNLRLIEKHAAARRTRKQDFPEQQTLPATDVDYSRKRLEVVRLKHCARVRKRIARHRTIENGLFFGMLLAIRPESVPCVIW